MREDAGIQLRVSLVSYSLAGDRGELAGVPKGAILLGERLVRLRDRPVGLLARPAGDPGATTRREDQ